jgi:copper chaperone
MYRFRVHGMTCGGCARSVTNALKAADPAASVSVDLAAKRVEVDSPVAAERLRKAIEDAGYETALEAAR